MEPKLWIVVRDGVQIVAAQHGCGAGDAPVNAYIDEYRNWVCPNCMATYGAANPLQEWGRMLHVEPS